jgi:hypothetical protein
LNALYGVDLHHLTWRDYATKRREIADKKTRAALLLGPRPCPTIGNFAYLLKRMNAKELNHWQRLRKRKNYRAAKQLLDEVYCRKQK